MGLFKQMKDMKATLHEAPAMVANAQALGAQAQAYAATQQAAAAAYSAPGAAPVAGDEPDPINGIDLTTYARVSKVIANSGVGLDGVAGVVSTQGINPDDWAAAVEGWNAR